VLTAALVSEAGFSPVTGLFTSSGPSFGAFSPAAGTFPSGGVTTILGWGFRAKFGGGEELPEGSFFLTTTTFLFSASLGGRFFPSGLSASFFCRLMSSTFGFCVSSSSAMFHLNLQIQN
jgi:hypothetical protein